MTVPKPSDFVDIRKKYTAEYSAANKEREWPYGRVFVKRDGETIYEYDRRYLFMQTFEPFRQLQGEGWHEYALISRAYTTFEVLDLESLEVVAKRPYPQYPWYRTDKYDQYENVKKKHPEWLEEGGYYAGKGPDDLMT